MIAAVPKETYPGERRVAVVPASLPALGKLGLEVVLEPGAGLAAGFPDRVYEEKGARLAASRAELLASAELVLQVRSLASSPSGPPPDLGWLRPQHILVGFLDPIGAPGGVKALAERGATAFALDLMSAPRYWGMGGIAALLLFLSVLFHELGHSYVALRYQIPIKQITLFIFGGMAHMGKEPPSPRAEFLIAMAGPLVSLILGASCLGGAMAVESLFARSGFQGLVVLGSLLGMVNVQLGIFNLIPGFPLDGGRVLRAGLWAWNKDFNRATSQAALVGIGFGVALGLIGAVLMVGAWSGALEYSIATNGGWLIFIGAFLFSAALAGRRQAALRTPLAAVTVRQVMVHRVVTLLPDMSVQDAVDQYFVAHGFGGFPVCDEGHVLGVVTVQDVQALPTALWPWRRVREIMRPASPAFCIPPDWSATQAMEQMVQGGWDRLVVMESKEIVGLVTRSAIAHFLQLRESESSGVRGKASGA